MHNRKRKNMFIMIAAICTIMIMTTGYAVLTQIIKVNGTITVERDWDVRITGITDGTPTGAAANELAPAFDDTTATFSALLYNKGDSMTYKITVENFGSWDAQLNTMTLTDSGNPAVKFTVSGVAEGDTLMSGSTHEITVKVEYDSTYEGDLESNVGTLTINLTYGQSSGGGSSSGGTNAATMLASKAVTSGDGLYADTYETGRYVYRGAAPNNYITFNGEEAGWRILSVESDGSIKIMKNSVLANLSYDTTGLRDSDSGGAGGTYCATAYSGSGCNAWMTSTNFGIGSYYVGTVLKDAELNTYLNNTYKNTFGLSSLIKEHSFNVGMVEDRDMSLAEQVSAENRFVWNGYVGLFSISEYIRTNSNLEQCGTISLNETNYETCELTTWMQSIIKTATNGFVWTMTPASTSYSQYIIFSDGYINTNNASDPGIGVIPVFYLKSDISLSGEGTVGSPYEIHTSWFEK